MGSMRQRLVGFCIGAAAIPRLAAAVRVSEDSFEPTAGAAHSLGSNEQRITLPGAPSAREAALEKRVRTLENVVKELAEHEFGARHKAAASSVAAPRNSNSELSDEAAAEEELAIQALQDAAQDAPPTIKVPAGRAHIAGPSQKAAAEAEKANLPASVDWSSRSAPKATASGSSRQERQAAPSTISTTGRPPVKVRQQSAQSSTTVAFPATDVDVAADATPPDAIRSLPAAEDNEADDTIEHMAKVNGQAQEARSQLDGDRMAAEKARMEKAVAVKDLETAQKNFEGASEEKKKADQELQKQIAEEQAAEKQLAAAQNKKAEEAATTTAMTTPSPGEAATTTAEPTPIPVSADAPPPASDAGSVSPSDGAGHPAQPDVASQQQQAQ